MLIDKKNIATLLKKVSKQFSQVLHHNLMHLYFKYLVFAIFHNYYKLLQTLIKQYKRMLAFNQGNISIISSPQTQHQPLKYLNLYLTIFYSTHILINLK